MISPEGSATPASTHSASCARSSCGTPSSRQIACSGRSREKRATKSNGSFSGIASIRATARRRSSVSSARMALAEKPLLTSERKRLCLGSSIQIRMAPAWRSSCSPVPPSVRPPPLSDEKVSGSVMTAMAILVARHHPEAFALRRMLGRLMPVDRRVGARPGEMRVRKAVGESFARRTSRWRVLPAAVLIGSPSSNRKGTCGLLGKRAPAQRTQPNAPCERL